MRFAVTSVRQDAGMDTREASLTAHAARHHGIIVRRHALDAGLPRHRIDQLVQHGRWVPVARGVYRIAGVPESWHQQLYVACCAADAVGSHRSALAVAGATTPPGRPHVTVPHGNWSRRPGMTIHRARLHPVDQTVVDGIAVTTVPRALVDLAGCTGPVELQRLVDSAFHTQRSLTTGAVEAAWERAQRGPGRHGWNRLDAALDTWRHEIRPASPAEARLLRMLQQWGFPEPDRQIAVVDEAGVTIGRIDVGWWAARVGLDYDSVEHHGPDRWGPDERRHVRISDQEWLLIHVDKADLLPGARGLRDSLERAFAARASMAHDTTGPHPARRSHAA